MRKLILKMSISVDGFVCGPHNELDWIFKSYDDEATKWTVNTLWQAGVHIMGSRTFQDMAAYWPTSAEPFAPPMNEIPKAVFTKKGFVHPPSVELTTRAFNDATRKNAENGIGSTKLSNDKTNWADSKIVTGNLEEEIIRMKQESGKDILAHGGAGFAQSLAQLNLVDEYRLLVHPVALGKGIPLFSEMRAPMHLTLVDIVTFTSGAAAHVYRPA